MIHTLTILGGTRQLRTRRALLQCKDVPLRTRRVLLLYKVYGNSALLVLNWTSLNCNNALLPLNWRIIKNIKFSGKCCGIQHEPLTICPIHKKASLQFGVGLDIHACILYILYYTEITWQTWTMQQQKRDVFNPIPISLHYWGDYLLKITTKLCVIMLN